MLVVILVQKVIVCSSVIWRINIHTLYPLTVFLLEQVERLPVFGVYREAVSHLIQIVKTRQQTVGEVWRKVAGIQRQGGVCFEKCNTAFRRLTVAGKQVLWQGING